jgi:hypothetical protein
MHGKTFVSLPEGMNMAKDVEDISAGDAKAGARLCNFVTSSAKLLPAHQAWIDQTVAPLLKSLPTPFVHITGFASRRGDAGFNQRLSDQRCQSVQAAIKKHSSTVTFPASFGKGESESGSVESDNDGFHRAVEVRLFETKPATPSPYIGVCGPDVTTQVTATWKQIQTDFSGWSADQKLAGCVKIMIPLNGDVSPIDVAKKAASGDLMGAARMCADINGWDVLPLFQNASGWLHKMPAGCEDCGTPAPSDADCHTDAHEAENSCSHSVQVSGKCWLNGTVNYGTYGIMIRLCSDMIATASDDVDAAILKLLPFPANMVPGAASAMRLGLKPIFSVQWAETLIRQYKKRGPHPESDVESPISWVQATFADGPTGSSSRPGNRSKCATTCKCSGGHIKWDYVWTPNKPR